MDQLIKDFSLLGLASLAVMTVVSVALTRRVLELAFPWLAVDKQRSEKVTVVTYVNRFAKVYNELVLYLLPYLWAAVFALAQTDFLFGQIGTYTGRLFLAFMVATFSQLFYKSAKQAVPKLFGVTVDADDLVLSIPPKE
jgi:hypothetical protein